MTQNRSNEYKYKSNVHALLKSTVNYMTQQYCEHLYSFWSIVNNKMLIKYQTRVEFALKENEI